MEKYIEEKLDFVSNLNGTTLNDLLGLISLFPMINFLCILIKIFLLYASFGQTIKVSNKVKKACRNLVFW